MAGNTNNNATTPQRRSSTPMHDSSLHMDTPNSAPSPLDEPQPLASSSMDPTMPTLSPHPPSKFHLEGNGTRAAGANGGVGGSAISSTGVLVNGSGSTQGNTDAVTSCTTDLVPLSSGTITNNGSNDISTGLTITTSSAVLCNGTAASSSTASNLIGNGTPGGGVVSNSSVANNVVNCNSNSVNNNSISNGPVNGFVDLCVKTLDEGTSSVGAMPSTGGQPFSWSLVTTKTESVCHWVHSHQQTNLKRPSLPTKGSESESDQSMASLYNYDSVNEW